MNEVQARRDQENEAFGAFLIETIAKLYGTEADPKRIDRAVYKNTACGAWARFDSEGIQVGTIVEGSDAEYSTRINLEGIEPSGEGEALLVARFREAIAECEAFSDEHFEADEE